MSPPNKNVVYFILNPKYGIIKIGVSSDPFERLNAFKSIYGPKLNLLGFVEGGIKLENKLHKRFDKYRLKIGDFGISETEWFLLEGELRKFVEVDLTKNKSDHSSVDKITKLAIRESVKNDLKDLKYDMRVDTFDEVVKRLIKKYKEE